MKKIKYSVIKWRNMDRVEFGIWAHLRLDKIEHQLSLDNRMPDLEEIAHKLESEATEKEAYTIETSPLTFQQFLTKWFIVSNAGFRHFLNRIFRPNQCKSQDKTPHKRKDKTSNV